MIFISSKVSDGNMSIFFGDFNEALKNKKNFFERNKINPKNVAEVKQIQGNRILKIDRVPVKIVEADGIVTDKDIYLMIKTADCMAISFYDKTHKAISLIHAGFRGLENGIIKKAIESMKQNFDTKPEDLTVKINPSIGPCHYRLDLWTEAEEQLIACGVLKENINNPKICTYESSDYFSHRRSEDKNQPEGRFATILGLNNAN